MKSATLGLLISLIASTALHAVPLRFLAWDDSITSRKIGVVSGGGVEPIVDLHPLKRTDNVQVSPGEGGLFLRALDRNGPDGKPLDVKIDKAGSFTNPLVIIFPDAKALSGLRALAVEDSSAGFSWGGFRVVNTTGKQLGLISGKQKPITMKGDWTPVDLTGSDTEALAVSIFDLAASRAKPAYSALWSPDPSIRRLVFITNSTSLGTGPLAVKVIVEDKSSVAVSR